MSDEKKKNSSSDFIDDILGGLISGEGGDESASAKSPLSPFQKGSSEKTNIVSEPTMAQPEHDLDLEKTQIVGRQRVHGGQVEEKISFGVAKPSTRAPASANAAQVDAKLANAENFRIAQQRLTELEKELEKLRSENELLSSASHVAVERADEYYKKLENIEKIKSEEIKHYQSEIEIFRDNNATKEFEVGNLRRKVSELETRVKQDLRKIRVRERELENRLEISKMEKETLLRNKDEIILDLKRKIEQLTFENDSYKGKIAELNLRVEQNHDQLTRTVRALRLALANLETGSGQGSGNATPFKKVD